VSAIKSLLPIIAVSLLVFGGLILLILYKQPHYTICQGGGFCENCRSGESYVIDGNCVEIRDTRFCGNYSIIDHRK
jgi:hypothetical protein